MAWQYKPKAIRLCSALLRSQLAAETWALDGRESHVPATYIPLESGLQFYMHPKIKSLLFFHKLSCKKIMQSNLYFLNGALFSSFLEGKKRELNRRMVKNYANCSRCTSVLLLVLQTDWLLRVLLWSWQEGVLHGSCPRIFLSAQSGPHLLCVLRPSYSFRALAM